MSPASTPSATMFGQAPWISAAIFFNAIGMYRAPLFRNTSGGAPCAGSPIRTLCGPSGISAAKRPTFCQSIAAMVRVAAFPTDAHHRGGLAAADLGPARARHQAVVAGRRGGFQQHIAGGHHAGAAATRERYGNRVAHGRHFG